MYACMLCMYVGMYVCMYVRMYACMYANIKSSNGHANFVLTISTNSVPTLVSKSLTISSIFCSTTTYELVSTDGSKF